MRSPSLLARELDMFRNPFVRAAVAGALSHCLIGTAFAQEKSVEEVVVTSTALKENPLEVAQPTTVIGGDDLHRQVAASLGETLAGELGVSSTYFGPSASQPVIRGLGGYRVQVLQDGAAALDVSSLSQDHAVSIEPVVSQQIEVIKGPAALLYGSGASGGLINVVTQRIPTKLPNDVDGAAELRGDTATGERTGALSIEGALSSLALHADYFDRSTDDVEIPSFSQSRELRARLGDEASTERGRLENSASDSHGGALGLSFIGDAGFAGVSWNRYDSTYGIPLEESAFIDMQQDRFDARGEWRAAGAWLDTLHGAAAYSKYTHTEFEAPAVPGTIFDQEAYEVRLTADHHWSDDWRGTLGTQYVDTDFVATGEEAFVPPSLTRSMAVFAFEERHAEKWTLELGARAERQSIEPEAALPDYDGTALSLSTGFVFKLPAEHALAVNLTRTQRHPQAAELYADGPHIASGRVEIGDPSLDKETALTADVSLRANHDRLAWTVNAFYNDYSDYIYLSPTGEVLVIDDGEALPINEYLQNGAKLYGYEAEVVVTAFQQLDRKLEVRVSSDYVRGKLDNGENLPQMPPLRVGLGLHFENDKWHLGVEAFRSLRQDDTIENELPTDSYTLLEANASYRMPFGSKHLLMFLRGTNLLDADARLATSPLKDIAPLPGRSLHLGVRAEW
jgi:iron complex outermembrane receptor protein